MLPCETGDGWGNTEGFLVFVQAVVLRSRVIDYSLGLI